MNAIRATPDAHQWPSLLRRPGRDPQEPDGREAAHVQRRRVDGPASMGVDRVVSAHVHPVCVAATRRWPPPEQERSWLYRLLPGAYGPSGHQVGQPTEPRPVGYQPPNAPLVRCAARGAPPGVSPFTVLLAHVERFSDREICDILSADADADADADAVPARLEAARRSLDRPTPPPIWQDVQRCATAVGS